MLCRVFRFRLCSKQWMSRTIAVLDCVKVSPDQKPDLSDFLGSKPKVVVFEGIIKTEDDARDLATLASTATKLVLNVLSPNESQNPLLSLGCDLKYLKSLVFNPKMPSPALVEAFLAWTPHMAKLEELEICCTKSTRKRIMDAVSQHCKRLKRLVVTQLYAPGDPEPATPSDYLQSMHSLESIVLPPEYPEYATLVSSAVMGDDIETVKMALKALVSTLPPQLHKLDKVMITSDFDEHSQPTHVHLLGSIFANASSDDVADFFIHMMKKANLFSGDFNLGNVLKTCLFTYNPSLLEKLIQAGVDLWMPMLLTTHRQSCVRWQRIPLRCPKCRTCSYGGATEFC